LKLLIPTNWQDDLIPKIKKDSVKELYGKLASDFIGGGRPAYLCANPSKEEVRSHIKEVHKHGMEFNYLLNATCMGNKEFTTSGQKKICQLLDWIVGMEVDSVTVATPYLLQLIKKRYPQLKVNVSSFPNINTIERARYWEDLGADRITLDEFILNRDFRLLRQIRKNVSCELQLIANNGCLYNCPFVPYHAITVSHSSQSEDRSGGFLLDYCALSCRYLRLTNPVNFIRANWIRPEDVHYYEDVGIDSLKLTDRTRPTEAIALAVDAYDRKKYNGNLIDLLTILSEDSFFSGNRKVWRGLKYFFRPFLMNSSFLYKLSKLGPKLSVYIDNSALDNFIEYFLERDCRSMSCNDCGYCEKVAHEAVKIEPGYQQETITKYKDILNRIIYLK